MTLEESFSLLRSSCGAEPSKFEALYNEVVSSPVNITAIKTREDFFLKHIFDSIYIFTLRKIDFINAADIGSGGGFPGIPISIFYPERRVALVESILKKCRFLENCALKLPLNNVDVINSRAENMKGGYDLITARGVGRVKDVLNATLHLSRKNTVWLLYKGERAGEEVAEAAGIIKKRGIKSEIIRIEEPIKRSYLLLRYN
ncbi:MAG: 16S rRNA (guanine(527)-N(7))-methyltransferase RsmG [Deferribacteraceae bacterium]|jgi:16S rRNA (guanine527-N7)-methyltransferase|nr:16S rRNA (guanine(527)-N(7))-methyltransferase RsmG [Deferribacteraceae bacterium]